MRICPACKKTYDDDSVYCSDCGTKTVEYVSDPKPAPVIVKKKPVGWIILTVLFFASTILFGAMYNEASETSTYYRREYNSLKAKYARIEDKADFMDDFIRIVSTVSNDDYYHKYGCTDLDTTEFLAYNIDAAKAKGYKPCPKCD